VRRAEAIENLRAWMPRGSTVYLVLRHRSRGGMTREIGVVVIHEGKAAHVSLAVAEAFGYRIGKRDGVIVHGCGMDMGFALIARIAVALHDEQRALKHEWI
jgi:hypothetical protein